MNQIISILGPNPSIIYYFLDGILKQELTIAENTIAYFLPYNLFRFIPENIDGIYLKWLADVLRSPLSDQYKLWFLEISQNRIPYPIPSDPYNSSNISTTIIASCLARNCPDINLKNILIGSCILPHNLEPYCSRKNDKYGIYFCNSDTLKEMQNIGFQIEVIDFGVAASSRTVNPDDLYLQVKFY